MNKDLAEMFRYNAWANRELFEACRSLTGDQLDMRVRGISGSVRELLLHIAGGQQTFVLRTKGRQHEGELGRQSDWPGFDAVMQIAASTSEELIAIAEQMEGEEEVGLGYLGKTYIYPKRFFLVHAMEHSTEHRTEVKIALASMGIETPDLDGWQYAQSAGYGREMTTRP
jgi:uncharacterized damage-inducible protein DinB